MLAFADPPSSSPELVARELANELMSPYCPGRTVASCTSSQARVLEDEILAEAQAGKSREEIKAELMVRFGEETLGSQTNPTVVYGTLLMVLLGGLMVTMYVRRRLAARGGATPVSWAREHAPQSTVEPSRAELDDLEDELDRVDDF